MKQIIALFGLLVGMMLLVAWLQKPENPQRLFSVIQKETSKEVKKDIVKIGEKSFEVEIANTAESRRVGLSEHDTLEAGHGMLFIFDTKNVTDAKFWMKGMSFPIDIIWIDDNEVVQITKGVPTVPADLPDRKIPTYKPYRTIDHVLEINAGEADINGIKVGDQVIL